MQDHQQTDAFRWFSWAEGPSGDPSLTPLAKVIAWLLAKHANNRTGRCYPSQALLMEASSSSLGGVRKAITALQQVGWISYVPGHGRTPSHYQLMERARPEKDGQPAPSRAGTPPREGRSERPEQGGGTTQRTSQRTEKDAPDGARSLSTDAEDAVREAVRVTVEVLGNVVANHTGVRPLPPTEADRKAARDWLGRVPPEQRQEAFREAMTFALADPFWAQKVTAFAKFNKHFDALLTAARAQEEKARLTAPCVECGGRQQFVGELDDDGYCDDCAVWRDVQLEVQLQQVAVAVEATAADPGAEVEQDAGAVEAEQQAAVDATDAPAGAAAGEDGRGSGVAFGHAEHSDPAGGGDPYDDGIPF